MGFPVPEREDERLEALRRYRILDTPPEESFDRITRLARCIFGVPIALVTLIDMNRQWFKSCYGLDIESTDRSESFCAHAIGHDAVLVVPDAKADPRFRDNPLVTGTPHIRFYAGAPMKSPDGHNLGTVCIIDRNPRADLSAEQRDILKDLAAIAMDEIELRQSAHSIHTEMQASGEAQRVAEQANLAKSEFLSRMSHELRTPLTAILGFGQLLEYGDLDANDRDSVEHILKAGNHLLGLINDVLDLSRIEAGKLMLSLEPVNVREVMQEVIDLMRNQALKRQIDMDRSPPAGFDVVVRADNQRLKQVLLNLVSNAVKYNRVGGSVRFDCTHVDDGRVRLAVYDAGKGISAESRVRLFQPFERLGADRSEIEGTGLGLALSKQLVEAMGGAIDVEPAPGGGSVAWVELPVAERPGIDLEPERRPRPEATTVHATETKYTVLYVEDNLPNVKLLDRILSYRRDIRLITAMQGRLGLQLALEHKPDLLLLDLHLPEMTGDEILEAIRTNPATHEMPIVMLSADATPGQVRRLLDAGANAYLTKPFDIAKIRETVDTYLK